MAGRPLTDASSVENGDVVASAPKSAVEKTPVGGVGVAVENVLVETQNEEPVAAESPLVPFSVALIDVTIVAALVVGDVVAMAKAEGATAPNARPNVLTTSVSAVSNDNDFCIGSANILFINCLVN